MSARASGTRRADTNTWPMRSSDRLVRGGVGTHDVAKQASSSRSSTSTWAPPRVAEHGVDEVAQPADLVPDAGQSRLRVGLVGPGQQADGGQRLPQVVTQRAHGGRSHSKHRATRSSGC